VGLREKPEGIEAIVCSNDVLQTDSVVPVGWGVFYPTNLNERRNLHGHARKQKPALKKRRPLWSTSRDHTKTAVGNVFHFPFNLPRFPMALMQWQLTAAKPPTR